MDILLPLIIILVLIFMNGVFVAAEFAIIGVRPTRIRQLADEGNKTAQWVLKIISDRGQTDRYIATSQLGITLASLGLGMYGEPAISHVIGEPLLEALGLEGEIVHTISFLFALFVITYLHVVLGEMVPKSLALQSAARVVLALASPMRFFERVFALPVRALNAIGLAVLRLIGLPPPSDKQRAYSPDELEMIFSEAHVGGLTDDYEQRLAANIFDFSARHAGQVMTPRPELVAVPVGISEDDLLGLVMETPFTRLPVYEGSVDNIVGAVHLKDIIRQHISGQPFDLRALLRRVPYVPEALPLDTLLDKLRRMRQHLAVVLDEHGGTMGVVTMEDIIEEVVGEVRDEFDTGGDRTLTVVEPGYIIAHGTVLLDEVSEIVPLGEVEHDVETIGGLVVAELGRPPGEGDEVTLGGTTIRVDEVNGLAVTRLTITFAPDEDSAPEDRSEH